jgi:hypothetical protein
VGTATSRVGRRHRAVARGAAGLARGNGCRAAGPARAARPEGGCGTSPSRVWLALLACSAGGVRAHHTLLSGRGTGQPAFRRRAGPARTCASHHHQAPGKLWEFQGFGALETKLGRKIPIKIPGPMRWLSGPNASSPQLTTATCSPVGRLGTYFEKR